jgi:ADP-ribose pyrophosphatase YjhB (NUDIX family)
MESNELPDETIKREIQEELGVKLDFSNLIYLDSNKNPQGTHHYYEMSVDEEFEPTLNQENQSYKWVNMGGFPSNTHPLLIKYLKSHIYA